MNFLDWLFKIYFIEIILCWNDVTAEHIEQQSDFLKVIRCLMLLLCINI